MPLQISCPNPSCQRLYRLADSMANKSVQCKQCGQSFVAGGSSTRDASPIAVPGQRLSSGPSFEGQRIGRFIVRQKLGTGAFGTVYRAYDPQLDREVALKVPNAGVLDSPNRIERFLREARAAANLRHPHIVPVHDAGHDGDKYYIASAFIDGRTLSDTIFDQGEDFARCARLVRELAEALAYAHEQGVVHRDVKPANIMVDQADRVHLMDFGLAARAEEASKLTNDGAVMGTPAYMAPEQAAGQTGEANPAADQFACGVVLYEVLTGEVPFSGPPAIVIHNILHTEPERPTKHRREIPRDLETICLKAMAKRPEDRYASCQSLADDLRRWQEGEPIAARAQTPIERVTRWVRRRPTQAGLVALGMVAIVLLAFTVAFAGLWGQAEYRRTEAEAAEVEAENARGAAEAAAAREVAARAESERLRREAEQARDREAGARTEAEGARDREATARRAEQKALEEAVAARDQLKQSQERLARVEYGRTIQLAHQEWRENNLAKARLLLESTRPEFRRWEWQYVFGACSIRTLVLKGHTGEVNAANFSPDGTRVVTASKDGSARIWDAKSGKELVALRGHMFKLGRFSRVSDVHSATWSPDGLRIATTSLDDRTVRIWDAISGEQLVELAGHTSSVPSAVWNRDGSRVATVSGDGTVRIWDARNGKTLQVLKGDSGRLTSVAFSRDGTRLVTGSNTGKAVIWDSKSGKELVTLPGHTDRINLVSFRPMFSPDGLRVLTPTQEDNLARIWDTRAAKVLVTFRGHTGMVRDAAYSPDGFRVVTGGNDRTARIWDARSGDEIAVLRGHTDYLFSVAFSADGTQVLTASRDGSARTWDARTGVELFALTGHGRGVETAMYSPNGLQVVTASFDRTARIWDSKAGTDLPPLKGHTERVRVAAWSGDGSVLLTGGDDTTARVWEPRSGKVKMVLKGHSRGVQALGLSSDGSRAVTASPDQTIRVWDVKTGKESLNLKGYTAAISPDGTRVIAVSGGKIARICDASSGQEIATLRGHNGAVISAAFSLDGKRIVTTSEDRTARIWDAASASGLHILRGHSGEVNSAAFNVNGTRLITGSDDRTARVWDANLGSELLTLGGHTTGVTFVEWSPDGERVITASGNRTAWIWDASSGTEVLALRHPFGIFTASFSPDGLRIATGSADGLVKIWDADVPGQ